MSSSQLNIFAVVSFKLGNEAATVRYERYSLAGEQDSQSSHESEPSQGLEVEDAGYQNGEPIYWVVEEDGRFVVEEYLTTTLYEQIENPIAGPFYTRYHAETFLRTLAEQVSQG